MKKLLILMIALIFTSCETTGKTAATDKNSLQGKWELTVLEGQNIAEKQPVYLEFKDDSKVSGFAGCNRLNGAYTLGKGNMISFNQLATTRMACPQMELEIRVLKMLDKADNFVIENDRLILKTGRSKLLAVFEAVYFE
ncbi:MAG: META domain-containing protein [Spirochaetia bacterium]|jgi:heat shock protein HslJ|nr:META domain-containing protein [Spirochaetia bacterium]